MPAHALAAELVISAPLVYTAWGLVWLLGYGAMWLSVRGQHPYGGPSGVSIAAVFVLAGFAAAAVLVIASRQSRASAAGPRDTAASSWRRGRPGT